MTDTSTINQDSGIENAKKNFYFREGFSFGKKGKYNRLEYFIDCMSEIPEEQKINRFLETLSSSGREISPALAEITSFSDMYVFLCGYLTCIKENLEQEVQRKKKKKLEKMEKNEEK